VSKYNSRLSDAAKGYSLSDPQRISSCGPNYCADDFMSQMLTPTRKQLTVGSRMLDELQWLIE